MPNLIFLQLGIDGFCLLFPESRGTRYQQVYTILNFMFLFVIPLLIIAVVYGAITFRIVLKPMESALRQTRRRHSRLTKEYPARASDDEHGGASRRKRKHVMMTVLGLVLAFLMCWLPL
jgi:hypothetical protein